MNVKELIERLDNFPYDAEIILGINLNINGKEKKLGSTATLSEDSDKNTVWIDMDKTVHVETNKPTTSLR